MNPFKNHQFDLEICSTTPFTKISLIPYNMLFYIKQLLQEHFLLFITSITHEIFPFCEINGIPYKIVMRDDEQQRDSSSLRHPMRLLPSSISYSCITLKLDTANSM